MGERSRRHRPGYPGDAGARGSRAGPITAAPPSRRLERSGARVHDRGDRLSVLGVVPSIRDTSPGQRFRIEQWEPYLRASGIDLDLRPFEDAELHSLLHQPGRAGRKALLIGRGFGRRAGLLARRREYDAIYLFREAALLGPPLLERCLAGLGPPLLFDFDDAIHLPYKSPTNGWLSLLKFPSKTRSVCRMATHVIVGNGILADYVRQVQDRVTIVPTTIDTTKYLPVKKSPSSPPVIGWSGSKSTLQHLDTIRPALQRLARMEPFHLRVLGADDYRLDGVSVQATAWSSARELHDLGAIDIGIMPLPDDPWSRGKCGLKALQYMALNIPTVCSPVGVNGEIIDHGHNGMLAATDEDWITTLTQMLRSPELCDQLGRAGRATVEARYSAELHAPRVAALIRDVVGIEP